MRAFVIYIMSATTSILKKRILMLKIAIQKSGRLHDQSIELLKECGLSIDNTKGQLKAQVLNFDAEILFLRNADIPNYVETGVADLAIIGDNIVYEKTVDINRLIPLGFSKCRLSIATTKEDNYKGLQCLNNKKIATSYPNSLKKFLATNNIQASIHQISGSVEIAPNIGLADAICDLVSSGNTLFKNNLVEQKIILQSQASLFANQSALKMKKAIIEQLVFRINSVITAKEYDYILFNIPNEMILKSSKILPGLKSPTVIPLLEKGWSSVHSVIQKNRFWEIINELKSIGAEGILVSPVQKMVC